MSTRLFIELTSSAIVARTSEKVAIERRMYFKNPVTAESFIETTFSTLNTVLSELSKRYGKTLGTVSECLIAYGAPWHSTHIESKKREFPKLTTVSAKDIEKMSDEHLKIQQEKLRKMAEGAKMVCIDDRILSVMLNDYRVPIAIDARVKSLSINHIATFVSEDDISLIEKAIKKHVHPKKFKHVPLLSLMYDIATSPIDNYNDAVVMSLSGEMTEICIIKDDVISSITSCPAGTHLIYRSVEKLTGVTYPRSTMLAQDAIAKKLSDDVAEKTKSAMQRGIEQWIASVSDVISKIDSERIPAVVFIHTPETERVIARMMLENQSSISRIFANTKPVVEFVDLCTGDILANGINKLE